MLPSDLPPLLAYVGELWPHHRPPAGAEAYRLRVQAWMDVVGDLEAQEVRAAIAGMAEREFAPTPGQVRAAVSGLHTPSGPSWDEWWRWVMACARRASLLAMGERICCPWPALQGVLTVADLMDGAVVVDEADLVNVRQGHLRRRFEAALRRHEQEAVGQVPIVAALLAARQPAAAGAGEPRRLLA